jgi:hypothetical protein
MLCSIDNNLGTSDSDIVHSIIWSYYWLYILVCLRCLHVHHTRMLHRNDLCLEFSNREYGSLFIERHCCSSRLTSSRLGINKHWWSYKILILVLRWGSEHRTYWNTLFWLNYSRCHLHCKLCDSNHRDLDSWNICWHLVCWQSLLCSRSTLLS